MTPQDFENDVRELLRLSGMTVTSELQLGHKKVDLYAEDHRWPTPHRIVMECKLYSKRLSQKELTAIYANYLSLSAGNQIDEILVETANGLAPKRWCGTLVSYRISRYRT